MTDPQPGPVLGASDCETIRAGRVAQPVSATSSLAFVLGAGVLAGWGGTCARPARLYAATMAAVGVGSWWYHGPQGPGARVVHDGTIAALIGAAVAVPSARWVMGRPVLGRGGRRRAQAAILLASVAGAAYAAGRTGSRTCRPGSPWQAHALWHVLAAASFTMWGAALWAPAPSR